VLQNSDFQNTSTNFAIDDGSKDDILVLDESKG
jgi:hypothetical protein